MPLGRAAGMDCAPQAISWLFGLLPCFGEAHAARIDDASSANSVWRPSSSRPTTPRKRGHRFSRESEAHDEEGPRSPHHHAAAGASRHEIQELLQHGNLRIADAPRGPARALHVHETEER